MKPDLVPRDLLRHAAQHFKMLGEPVRLALLNQLHTQGEMNVQELVEATGQSQANVSRHLRLMDHEGLVARRKEGLYAFYRIEDPTLFSLCLLVCNRLRDEDGSDP